MSEDVSKERGLQRALLALLVAALCFLAFVWFAPRADQATLSIGTKGELTVPGFRFFTREDGLPVAEAREEELSAFLTAAGIPLFGQAPPPIEAGVARNLERAMRTLAGARSADNYCRLGEIFDALGLTDQTSACFEIAVRLTPDAHRWRHHLGRQLAGRGELVEAEIELRRATELDPNYLASHWRLARVCAQQGRTAEAEEILRKTLNARVSYPRAEPAAIEIGRAHALMSQAPTGLGDDARAAAHARKGRYSAKGLDPILVEGTRAAGSVASLRASAYAQNLDGPPAVAQWERICAADPTNADDRIRLAEAYFGVGRQQDAVRMTDLAIEQVPEGSRFRLSRARMAPRLNDMQGALKYADQALELDPDSVQALGMRSLTLLSVGRAGEALEPAKRALELAPDNAQVYEFLGSIYARIGRPEEARGVYLRGLGVDPESELLQAALARLTEEGR